MFVRFHSGWGKMVEISELEWEHEKHISGAQKLK